MIPLGDHTALLVIDVQNDFCPGGSLPVPDGDAVVAALNRVIPLFAEGGLPVMASRDWHPFDSRHFATGGGIWPPHCVRETTGAEFHSGLKLPEQAIIISKGMGRDDDAYSAFQGTTADGSELGGLLARLGVRHLIVGGLATDYCVKASVLDALAAGLSVTVLMDAVRGVDLQPGDSARALEAMVQRGASVASADDLTLP